MPSLSNISRFSSSLRMTALLPVLLITSTLSMLLLAWQSALISLTRAIMPLSVLKCARGRYCSMKQWSARVFEIALSRQSREVTSVGCTKMPGFDESEPLLKMI